MIVFFAGLFLLAAPFCLAICFKNKAIGFTCVFICSVLFHLSLALLLQYAGIFSYATVLGCTGIAVAVAIVCCITYCVRKKIRWHTSILTLIPAPILKIDWFVLFAFALVFYELFSVHYFYTGIIINQNGYDSVTHAAYQYPYFSDEYAGIAFTSYSIRSHSLPLVDPLHKDVPATNILVGFFALTAELFLLLGLNPLAGYVPFAIAGGMLVCLLVYLFLRSKNVNSFAAACAVLCMPLIVNGGNLAGIWSFLPFVAGFMMFLAGLIVLSENSAIFIISMLLSLVLYPPMVVLVAPVLAVVIGSSALVGNRRLLWIIIGVTCAAMLVSLAALEITGTFPLIFRDNLVGGIPSFPLWVIVPWFALPFAAIGVYECVKKKRYAFIASLAVGIVFWIAYAYTTTVFIIDYSRIAALVSILIVVASGFGIDFLTQISARILGEIRAEKALPVEYKRWALSLKVAIALVFIVIASSYPLETWAELVLHGPAGHTAAGNVIVAPAPPVSDYLTARDLTLFSNISGQTFIAPPWKGLVIGAATDNYPLQSKPATLTESFYSYVAFMALDCASKTAVAKTFSLNYVYSEPFSCDNFIPIGSSTEGLYLYKFSGYN